MKLFLPLITLIHAFQRYASEDYEHLVRNEACVMFVRRACPYSKAAVRLLRDKNVRCKVIEVDSNINAHHFSKLHHATFPTMFFKGNMVGGYTEIDHLEKEGLPPFSKGEGTYYVGDEKHILVSK